jgi:hypothetical protein
MGHGALEEAEGQRCGGAEVRRGRGAEGIELGTLNSPLLPCSPAPLLPCSLVSLISPLPTPHSAITIPLSGDYYQPVG